MLNRIYSKLKQAKILFPLLAVIMMACPAIADDFAEDEIMDDVGASAVLDYDPDGSMFQKIADLEQEKVLMQLEKERAQLELDLDRLTAEKIKLQMEIDTISGRAEEQAAKLENEKQKLETERANLEAQRKKASETPVETPRRPAVVDSATTPINDMSEKYKLVEIVGAGRQLQATLEDITNGQKKKIWAGKSVDGFDVKSISLDDGVVFSKDGETYLLNIEIGNKR